MNPNRTVRLFAVAALSLFAFSAQADDATAQAKLAEGRALYAQRADLAKNKLAIAALEEAVSIRCWWLGNALVDPRLAPLQGDPRWAAIVAARRGGAAARAR